MRLRLEFTERVLHFAAERAGSNFNGEDVGFENCASQGQNLILTGVLVYACGKKRSVRTLTGRKEGGVQVYRGASLITKCPPIGTHSRSMRRALW